MGLSGRVTDANLGSDVLGGLPMQHREHLLLRAQYRRYRKNQTICAHGATANFFYLIESGWVSVCRYTADGKEVVIDVAGPGEYLQLLPAHLNDRYSTELKAASMDVAAFCISGSALRNLGEGVHGMHERLFATLFGQFRTMEDELEQIKAKTGLQRIIDFLLSVTFGECGSASVELPYDKSIVSSYLGIAPASLSRLFNKLRTYGVSCHGNVIYIECVRKLRRARASMDS